MLKFTKETRETLHWLMLLEALPENINIDVDENGDITSQCATQDDVRRLRAAFPGTIWRKSYSQMCQWWDYDAKTPGGRNIHIYACREAPPTCKAIVKEVEVEEKVPVVFETRMVKKEIVTWDCGGDAA